MKKTIITLLAALPLCASAQFGNLFKTDNQALVEQAISGGVVLVSQSYQLADSAGELYGRFGEQEFGTITSIGIRVDSGLVVTDATSNPWNSDENFDRYRDTHTPMLYQTFVYAIGDSITSDTDSTQLVYTPLDGGLYYTTVAGFKNNGYVPKRYNGATEGWVAWLYNSYDDNGEAIGSCEYLVVKQTLQLNPRLESISIQAPQNDKDYVGGVFIVPEQTAVGQLTFFLAGIIVYDQENGAWSLQMPTSLIKSAEMGEKEKGLSAAEELTPTIKEILDKKDSDSKDKKGKGKKKK